MQISKLKELRFKAGIRQVELAKSVGVSQAMISSLENGTRKGSPDTIYLIAAELHCSVEDITGEPSFFIQFIRNCKRLSRAQIQAVNEVVIQLTIGPSR